MPQAAPACPRRSAPAGRNGQLLPDQVRIGLYRPLRATSHHSGAVCRTMDMATVSVVPRPLYWLPRMARCAPRRLRALGLQHMLGIAAVQVGKLVALVAALIQLAQVHRLLRQLVDHALDFLQLLALPSGSSSMPRMILSGRFRSSSGRPPPTPRASGWPDCRSSRRPCAAAPAGAPASAHAHRARAGRARSR